MVLYIYFIGYKLLPDIKMDKVNNALFEKKVSKDVPQWKQTASVVVLLAVFLGMIFEKETVFLPTLLQSWVL